MVQEAPSHQDNVQVNGVVKPVAVSDTPRPLPVICDELRRKVIAFLEEQTDDVVLQNVQSQVRVTMGIIEEAMRRFG